MYTVNETDISKRNNNFTYHAPKEAQGTFVSQASRYEFLRNEAKKLCEILQTNCPPSRELSVAITKLEEVMFWANASIARNE